MERLPTDGRPPVPPQERHKPEQIEQATELVYCRPHGCTGKAWWAVGECEYSRSYRLQGADCELFAVVELKVAAL